MGLYRAGIAPSATDLAEPKAKQQALTIRDEDERRREVKEKVRQEMLALFAPAWAHQSEKMIQFFYQSCANHDWFEKWDLASAIIAIRTELDYEVFPSDTVDATRMRQIARTLNVEVCFLMTSHLVSEFVRTMAPNVFEIRLGDDLRIQIRNDLEDFQHAKKNQHASFLRNSGQLLLWHNDFHSLVPFSIKVEDAIATSLWNTTDEKRLKRFDEMTEEGLDWEMHNNVYRPVKLLLPTMVFCTIILNFMIISLALRAVVYESLRCGNWYRLTIISYFPALFFLCSFFSLMLIVTVINFVGPVQQLFENSKYYSCLPPLRIKEDLPVITIQCPVYKEDLHDVIVPTIQSIKVAISTYEQQGGSARIFINDDGLQLLSSKEREMRKVYYALNDVGWVARPGHGKDGFVRQGRFKKASNMNFAMDMSVKVKDKLEQALLSSDPSEMAEEKIYDDVLSEVLSTEFERTGHQAWASGDIRIGQIILLVDSDTRVPRDCLLDAASEFHWSPQVAILQHQSGVMQVVHDFWENAITYFTQCIYFSLQWATSAGDTAAFVGHNAFLRWSALQEISVFDEFSGRTQWWSECHVSEDFEMSLKLQCQGYVSRYATYSNEGFQEGVSLTCYDEMLRWSKYAYGCSELVFNPFSKWLTLGPFTHIFIKFIRSDLSSFSKFTMLSYIGTYYAIALWPMLVLNYFIAGWYLWYTERAYVFFNEGYGVFMTVILLFNVVGPVSTAASKYRARNQPFWSSVYTNFKWSILLCIFLGGLAMHLSYALVAHMCGLNIQWGATAKSVEQVDFFAELPKIWAKFKYVYLTVALLAVMQLYFAFWAAPLDRIWGLTANLPLIWLMFMHVFAPLILNHNSYPSEWTSNIMPYFKKSGAWVVSLFSSRMPSHTLLP